MMIDLVGLIAQNFGLDRAVAQETVDRGKVSIDGRPYEGDPNEIPIEAVANKDITVRGFRNVRVHVVG